MTCNSEIMTSVHSLINKWTLIHSNDDDDDDDKNNDDDYNDDDSHEFS